MILATFARRGETPLAIVMAAFFYSVFYLVGALIVYRRIAKRASRTEED